MSQRTPAALVTAAAGTGNERDVSSLRGGERERRVRAFNARRKAAYGEPAAPTNACSHAKAAGATVGVPDRQSPAQPAAVPVTARPNDESIGGRAVVHIPFPCAAKSAGERPIKTLAAGVRFRSPSARTMTTWRLTLLASSSSIAHRALSGNSGRRVAIRNELVVDAERAAPLLPQKSRRRLPGIRARAPFGSSLATPARLRSFATSCEGGQADGVSYWLDRRPCFE